MHEYCLLLGSNIDPEIHIPLAVEKAREQLEIKAISGWYQSQAVGRPDQPSFINMAVRISNPKPAKDLKWTILRPLEESLGRVRTADKYAPRGIDIDIVWQDKGPEELEGNRLPDPDILRHGFMGRPVAEVLPEVILPGQTRPLGELVLDLNFETDATRISEAI